MNHEDLYAASTGADGDLWTIRQFCEAHKWPSESAMRAYVYRADELGIGAAFSRVGRRVLVSPKRFFSLIKMINEREQGNKEVPRAKKTW